MTTSFALPAYGWRPRRDQLPIWNSMVRPDFRRGVIVGHRRYGKDELGLQMTAVKAMSRVGSYWYCLPEYEQARKAIWEMVNWRTQRTRINDAFPPEIVADRDEKGMMLWLTSGSTVQLIGSDRVDSLVGGGQIGIVMSEASLSNPKAIQFFRPILEESKGWELQIATPRGKNHFYRAYKAVEEDMRNGVPGMVAALRTAMDTDVFLQDQLFRIELDLIREHGTTIGTALFEQEYLCSFTAAVIGAVWSQEVNELQLEGRVGPYGHDRRFPVITSWDIGVGDATVILFWQHIGSAYRLVDAHEGTGIGLDSYIEVLKQKHSDKGYIYARHQGPHDVKQREWVRGLSRMEEAARMGLKFTRTPNTRIKTQIAAGAQLIRQMQVNENCPEAVAAFEHIKEYKFPVNPSTGQVTPVPIHDEHSHTASALMTMAVSEAAKLGVNITEPDTDLGGGLNTTDKFDPRYYDTGGAFGGGGLSRTRSRGTTAFG